MGILGQVEWPDWALMEHAVRLDHFQGSNDEFCALRRAVRAAGHGPVGRLTPKNAEVDGRWWYPILIQKQMGREDHR